MYPCFLFQPKTFRTYQGKGNARKCVCGTYFATSWYVKRVFADVTTELLQLSWLERGSNKPKVLGSSPSWSTFLKYTDHCTVDYLNVLLLAIGHSKRKAPPGAFILSYLSPPVQERGPTSFVDICTSVWCFNTLGVHSHSFLVDSRT